MPVETIFIARHGFRTAWGADLVHAKTPTGTPRDVPLTAHGVDQAQELCRFFQDQNLDAIFSSPYYRCLQTARPLSKATGLPIFVEAGFAEWFLPAKQGTGRHPFPKETTELANYFDEIDVTHSSLVRPSRQGETKDELHSRTAAALQQLIHKLDQSDKGPRRLIIFSHAATIIALGRALTGNATLDVPTGCCSASKYDRKTSDTAIGSWNASYVGKTTFLKLGEERSWSFDLVEEGDEEDGMFDQDETSSGSKL